MGILIPDVFHCLNDKKLFNSWQGEYFYNCVYTKKGAKASACIGCGACEESCPQHLPIRELLCKVAEEFENKADGE
jgi:predicted aldo/keto reductase-like oxidoreductase